MQVYVYESDIKMPLAGLPAGVLAHALVKLRVADVKVMLELLTEMGLIAGALDAFLAQLPASRTSLHYYAQHHQSAFACTHCQHESIADADQTSNGDASASSTATAAAAPNRTHMLAFFGTGNCGLKILKVHVLTTVLISRPNFFE